MWDVMLLKDAWICLIRVDDGILRVGRSLFSGRTGRTLPDGSVTFLDLGNFCRLWRKHHLKVKNAHTVIVKLLKA